MEIVDINDVNKIARQAGDAIMDIYNSDDIELEMKQSETDGFVSPLTKADKASHEIITAELSRLYPELPIVSEEQEESINLEAVKQTAYWVIDPIDGTKGFVKRDGEFTINIALVENEVPVLGVVYVPVKDELFYTDKDGAKLQINGEEPQSIHASSSTKAENVVASKNHLDEATEKFLSQFGDINIVQAGSSIKICKVATGEAELYPRLGPTTMEWDTAAADAVLRAAGGKMIDTTGEILKYGKLPELRNQGFVAQSPNVEFEI